MAEEFNAYFYTLVSQDTSEMGFSRKRQRFLVNQGYAYKVVTKLAGLSEDKDLHYKTHDEHVLLLQQVMAATDADAEEEGILGPGGSKVKRTAGNMASMSGADDNLYTEFKKSKMGIHHPLFKKFRLLKDKK